MALGQWQRLVSWGSWAARAEFSLVVHAETAQAVVFGGYDHNTLFGDAWRIDLATGASAALTPVPGAAPTPRYSHCTKKMNEGMME